MGISSQALKGEGSTTNIIEIKLQANGGRNEETEKSYINSYGYW